MAPVDEALRSASGIIAAARSDAGGRARNEDAFAVVPDADLYVVSDGVGGRPGGDTASQIVIAAVPELLRATLASRQMTQSELHESLTTALARLSKTVRRESERWAGQAGMGATVVLAVVRDGRLTIAHIGDSRAYRYHQGKLARLTFDHSVVGILLEQGAITEEEVAGHPARGRITRYVGMGEAVEPDVTTVDFEPGDRLLLCTDGLTTFLSDDAMTELLRRPGGGPASACDALVQAALDAGTTDNVTALVAERPSDAAEPGQAPARP